MSGDNRVPASHPIVGKRNTEIVEKAAIWISKGNDRAHRRAKQVGTWRIVERSGVGNIVWRGSSPKSEQSIDKRITVVPKALEFNRRLRASLWIRFNDTRVPHHRIWNWQALYL